MSKALWVHLSFLPSPEEIRPGYGPAFLPSGLLKELEKNRAAGAGAGAGAGAFTCHPIRSYWFGNNHCYSKCGWVLQRDGARKI